MLRIIFYIFIFLSSSGCFLSFTPKRETQDQKWHQLPQNEPTYTSDELLSLKHDYDKILSLAQAQLGVPYRYGGMSESGFDCSGFVCYIYKNALGKKLPHNANRLSTYVHRYELSQLQKGDLVFFDTSGRGKINHCGIYLGDGKFIHASSGKAHSVTTSDLTKGFYKKAFRWGGKVRKW